MLKHSRGYMHAGRVRQPSHPLNEERLVKNTGPRWEKIIKQILPQIVRIETADGKWGTGFIHYSRGELRSIATAKHVVAHAEKWQQPIRIVHGTTSIVLGGGGSYQGSQDVLFGTNKNKPLLDCRLLVAILPGLPEETVPIADASERQVLEPGTEIGWLGYPQILDDPTQLCFFSGRISHMPSGGDAFLVDGTAIGGVSGGPAFCPMVNGPRIVGTISAYIPNIANGGTSMPGLAVVTDVSSGKDFENLLEAAKLTTIQGGPRGSLQVVDERPK